MDIVNAILGLTLLFAAPATIIGGIAAIIALASGHRAVRAFWIAFVIVVAIELILFGICLAAFRDFGG